MPSTPSPSRFRLAPGSRTTIAIALPLLFILFAWPLMFGQLHIGRAAADQSRYHEPAVRTFIEQWPNPDVGDYLSATTPGYHLALAAVGHYVSDSCIVLHVAGSAFTLLLLASMGWYLGGRLSTGRAIAAAAPIFASVYIFSAGVWLIPDNAGWLGVLAMLLISLRSRFRLSLIAIGALALLYVVLVRQIHIWTAAPFLVAAYLGNEDQRTDRFATLFTRMPTRIARSALALAACLPAIGALFWFYRVWDGNLIPPTFTGWYSTHISPATAAFFLTVFAMWSPLYLGYLVIPAGRWLKETPRRALLIAALAAGLGLLAAAIPETVANRNLGRYFGIWHVVERLPSIGGHASLLILIAAPIGAMLLAAWLAALTFRARLVTAAAILAFVTAQTASPQLWQRYHEPFVVLLLPLLAAAASQRLRDQATRGERPLPEPQWLFEVQVLGPAALASMLAAITTVTLFNATPPPPGEGPRIVNPTEADEFFTPPETDTREKCSQRAGRAAPGP